MRSHSFYFTGRAIIFPMEDLKDLIERAKRGDTAAFKEIYKTFYSRIYRYLIYNGQNEEGAKDLAQETFIRAWKSLPSFTIRSGGTLQAFLFRIARNLLIDRSRKKKEYPLKDFHEIETQEDFVEDFAKKQQQKNVKKALGELEEKDRQIVILRYFEELSTGDTAKALKMKEGALRVRIHRVLRKLQTILERYDN